MASRITSSRKNSRRKRTRKPTQKSVRKPVPIGYRANQILRLGFFFLIVVWVWKAVYIGLAKAGDVQVLAYNAMHAFILMSMMIALATLARDPIDSLQGIRAAIGVVYFVGILAGLSLY